MAELTDLDTDAGRPSCCSPAAQDDLLRAEREGRLLRDQRRRRHLRLRRRPTTSAPTTCARPSASATPPPRSPPPTRPRPPAAAARTRAVITDEQAELFGAGLYADGERDELPDTALLASLGCGNPTAMADLHAGETVLDLGSGGGIDVLLSARRVGPTGTAYGLDMTDEMLDLARANQAKAGVENVHWLKGHIEAIPLPADTVDVVLSNCVINLSTDKPQVLREAARVLKPGGRFAVSDVIADPGMDDATRADIAAVRRLHRRRAHRATSTRATSPTPASPTSRSPRPTASTSTPARRSSAPASPPESLSGRFQAGPRRSCHSRAPSRSLADARGAMSP